MPESGLENVIGEGMARRAIVLGVIGALAFAANVSAQELPRSADGLKDSPQSRGDTGNGPTARNVPLSREEVSALRTRIMSLWNVNSGAEHPEELRVVIRIRLNPDRRLAGPPQVVSSGSSLRYQAAVRSAVRAVQQGEPYTMLRDETYETWKEMEIDFDPKVIDPSTGTQR
jgi:hypothetical protein